ncbi:hypothetical protein ACEQPO_09755 [Bacillus sp. SL00103]
MIAGAGATGATGTSGATGSSGATGQQGDRVGLTGSVPFDPTAALGYPVGQMVTSNGSTYIVNTASPTGTQEHHQITLIAGAGATGATGTSGATGSSELQVQQERQG